MIAPPLREVQQLFVASLGNGQEVTNLSKIVDSREPDPCERIGVYVDAYFLRLKEVLSEDFPHTLRLLGDDGFARLARAYIAHCPSQDPSLIWFGQKFPEFLRTACPRQPWQAELAKLEWFRIEAFSAPACHVLTLADLAKIPAAEWAEIRFAPVLSFRFVDCQWAVHDLWAGESAASVELQPTSLRVWRNADYQVLHARIDDLEAAALRRLIDKRPFAEIIEVFADSPHAPSQAASLLGRWLVDGLLSKESSRP
jgi:hypothetical protein